MIARAVDFSLRPRLPRHALRLTRSLNLLQAHLARVFKSNFDGHLNRQHEISDLPGLSAVLLQPPAYCHNLRRGFRQCGKAIGAPGRATSPLTATSPVTNWERDAHSLCSQEAAESPPFQELQVTDTDKMERHRVSNA